MFRGFLCGSVSERVRRRLFLDLGSVRALGVSTSKKKGLRICFAVCARIDGNQE